MKFRSVGLSLIARAGTFPITAAATFVNTALIINYAGGIGYGAISLIAGLFLLIPFADLGLGAAVINLMSSEVSAAEKRAGVIQVFRVLCAPAAFVVLIGLAGSTLFSWGDLLGIEGIDRMQASIATTLAVSTFGLTVPLGVGQRVLTGMGRNHLGVLLSATSSVAIVLATVLMIWGAVPSAILAVATPLGLLISATITTFVAFRALDIGPSAVIFATAPSSVGKLFRTGLPMLLVMVGLPLAFQTHRIVLSLRSDPMELSAYSLAMQFYTPVWSFISVAAISLWPLFRTERSQGSMTTRLAARAYLLFAGIGAIGFVGISFFVRPLGTIISGGEVVLEKSLIVGVATLVLVQALQQVPGMYLTSDLGLWFQARSIFFMVPIVLFASWTLSPLVGASAPIWSTVVAVVVCQIFPGTIKVFNEIRRDRA